MISGNEGRVCNLSFRSKDMAQQLTFPEEDVTRKIRTVQSKLIKELALQAISCIKDWETRKRENTLTFGEFIMVCLIEQDVTMELKERYRLTRHEIAVAKMAITLHQIEIEVGGEIKGKFFKNFLYDCMVIEDVSPEICYMYGLNSSKMVKKKCFLNVHW